MSVLPHWKALVQFASGVLVIAVLSVVVWTLRPRPVVPSGWQIIDTSGDVMALAYYRGAVWAGGQNGLVRIDPASGAVLETVRVENRGFRFVAALLVTQDDALWVGHSQGASRFDGTTWETWDAAGGLPSNRVYALLQTRDGALWVGMERGLVRRRDEHVKVFTRNDGLASDTVSVLFEDSRGILWAGNGVTTEGGLSAWDGAAWRVYGTSDGLVHPMVNAIVEDREGVLWFGTGFAGRGGVSLYDGKQWTSLTREDGLAGDKVRSLFQDAAGVMWVGSEYDGVACATKQGWRVLDMRNGLSGMEVKSMLQTPDGDLWLGTERGITRISAVVLAAWENVAE